MKPGKKQQTESSASAKIAVGVVAICALAGTALAAVYYWPQGPGEKIADLQQELLADDADQLTERQKERVQDQLICEVDQLDDQQRREVWEGVRERFRNRLRTGVEEFHALPEAGRAAFVDAELADLGRWRRLLYTMGPQEPYVPRRFRKSEQEAIAREQALAKEAAERDGDNSSTTEPRRDRGEDRASDRGGVGQRGRGSARAPDRGGDSRSDRGGQGRGRRRGWGFGAPEEGMEDQYAAYWQALQQRRRELWEARYRSRGQASQGERR